MKEDVNAKPSGTGNKLSIKKKFFRFLKLFILIYCSIGIAVYYLQDKILFKPVQLPPAHKYAFKQPYEELDIPYAAGSNMNVIQFKTDSTPKGVVLYFHGNKKNIERYATASENFTRNGYEVWMIDYPGFGKSTGDFTEQKIYDWALTFYRLARARFAPDSIVLYGKSLGTGFAAQLASVRDCKYLILETPYFSFPSVVGNYLPIYPVNTMIRFKMPVWQFLQHVTAPVVIFHGTSDWTIPIRNANRLKPYLKPGDQFIVLEGGKHNDLPEYENYHSTLDSLLN